MKNIEPHTFVTIRYDVTWPFLYYHKSDHINFYLERHNIITKLAHKIWYGDKNEDNEIELRRQYDQI